MGLPCPPHWTFAARAAYFGDPLCAFCYHRNPAGAKFCNDCASPLHLKPCNQCDAVNHQDTTDCYKCGSACPVPFDASGTHGVLPAADPTTVRAEPGDVAVPAAATQRDFAASELRAGGRVLRSGQLVLAAIATLLIAGAYGAYRVIAAAPDAPRIASLPVSALEHKAPISAPAVSLAIEEVAASGRTPTGDHDDVAAATEDGSSKVAEPEQSAAPQAPRLVANPEVPNRLIARQRPVPVPVAKHSTGQQRTVREGKALVKASPPVAHSLPAARGARVAEPHGALRKDPWQMMNVSLARCSGDLFARLVCDQRVRREFCQGHWGEVPECASGFAYEHRP